MLINCVALQISRLHKCHLSSRNFISLLSHQANDMAGNLFDMYKESWTVVQSTLRGSLPALAVRLPSRRPPDCRGPIVSVVLLYWPSHPYLVSRHHHAAAFLAGEDAYLKTPIITIDRPLFYHSHTRRRLVVYE